MALFEDRSGERFGDYRLLRRLGRGNFSEVYLAEEMRERREVAIKLLQTPLTNREHVRAFLNEARSFRLKHPHIVSLLDIGISEQDLPFLVMEYVAGGTMRGRYPKGTQVSLHRVISHTKQIASALQYAHDRQLIHRDVKPENMLWRADDAVLLSDFGLVEVAHASSSLNPSEQVGGTLPYMAPEQFQGKPRAASDQYALAVVVYEWMAGARPFQGTTSEILLQHMHAEPPSLVEQLPTLPKQIEQVVFQALAKQPKDRFPSVQDFANALQAASQLSPSAFSSTSPRVLAPSVPPSSPTTLALPDEHQTSSDSGATMIPISEVSSSFPMQLSASNMAFTSATSTHTDAWSSLQRDTFARLPVVRRRPLYILVFLLIAALLLGISGRGIYLLSTSGKPSSVHHPNGQTSSTLPATPSAVPTDPATAMKLYQQYTSKTPVQEYTPANSSQWIDGSPYYGICEHRGSQEFHAIAPPRNIDTCIAPSPNLTNDFAVQTKVTILQGAGAGLVFGFYLPANSSNFYNGFSYIWSFCIVAGCPSQAVYLDYGFSSGSGQCLGPNPGPGYPLTSSQYCNVQSPAVHTDLGQPNILTVIVLHGEIYMYVNATFSWSITRTTGAIYPTNGQVGFAALSDKSNSTDVSFQDLKIWPIQD
jgi:serine/threonine protein kinase